MEKTALEKLQDFIKFDKTLKEAIIKICPLSKYEAYDENSLIKYTNYTYGALKYIFSALKPIKKAKTINELIHILHCYILLYNE